MEIDKVCKFPNKTIEIAAAKNSFILVEIIW
jgi:hypothetical protein